MGEKIKNTSKGSTFNTLTAFFILAASIIGYCILSPDPAATAAREIYFALEKYHADHGVFPDELDELVGSYTPSIPDGVMAYKRNEETGYFFMVCKNGLLVFPVENCHTRSELMLRHGSYSQPR